jgi:VanZ family protein
MNWRLVVLILWTLILLSVLLAPIPETAIPTLGGFKHWDKVAHFGLFAITGLAGVFGATFLSRFKTRMLSAIAFGLFLAVGTEFAQSLIPARNPSLYDLLADVVGLGISLALYAFLYSRYTVRSLLRL